MTANVRWTGEPERCECTRMVVADVAETLACPLPWRYVGGTGWVHYFWGRGTRTGRARKTTQAAS